MLNKKGGRRMLPSYKTYVSCCSLFKTVQRWVGHSTLRLVPEKEPVNKALIKLIFEAVTEVLPWGTTMTREHQRWEPTLSNDDFQGAPDSLERARKNGQASLL